MKNIRREDWESLEPTVYGWGIVDVNYVIRTTQELPRISGKRNRKTLWICPYYTDWASMIERCFGKSFQEKHPTYKGCTIDPDWKYLSNFIKWVDSQPNRDWQNYHLDKDILVEGNKHYGPNTVAYIPVKVNSFVLDRKAVRGRLLLGVNPVESNTNPYCANCSNPLDKNVSNYIGVFKTELEAHKAWQERKHLYACQLADLQQDPRVARALRERYAPDKDWSSK